MLTSSQYQALAAVLDDRGAALHTTPEQYQAPHELPGWYPHFAEATPASVWMPAAAGEAPTAVDVAQLIEALGPGRGIVKDYVKSRKHEWDKPASSRISPTSTTPPKSSLEWSNYRKTP